MRIDWSAADISNHEKLRLEEMIADIPVDRSFDHVIPLDGGCRTIRISRHLARNGFDAVAAGDHSGDPRSFTAIDYDVEQGIGLDYHYCNAGGAELSGMEAFRGRISFRDHIILLTALSGAEMGCFIPSQVGLEDLQGAAEWELDFEDHDHVWHGFERLIRIPHTDGAPIEQLVAACAQKLSQPWDDEKAMRDHLGAS